MNDELTPRDLRALLHVMTAERDALLRERDRLLIEVEFWREWRESVIAVGRDAEFAKHE